MRPYSENEFAEFWIEDDILHFVYKKDVDIDLKAAKKIVDDRIALQNGVSYPAFCDFRGANSTTNDARDYLANEGSSFLQGVAILMSSPIPKIIDNFYMVINKPRVPTRVFTDKESALNFLKSLEK